MKLRVILGIETSCDETAAAVLVDGKIIADRTTRQTLHEQYGGVVPELASRAHERLLAPAIDGALAEAKMKINDVEAIAVTNGPGLAGALLVGVAVAKGLSKALKIPIFAVNHLEGHIWAVEMSRANFGINNTSETSNINNTIPSPFLALIVSGGHTILIRVDDFGKYTKLCTTRDDAAGELLDKVGRMLGLAFPAGAKIDQYALKTVKSSLNFPRAHFSNNQFAYSFSGLKTAVNYYLKTHPELYDSDGNINDETRGQICRAVMESVADMLSLPVEHFLDSGDYKAFVVGGGVSASVFLRNKWEQISKKHKVPLFISPPDFCTDNGAMIAYTGWKMILSGVLPASDDFAVEPSLSLFK